MKTKITISLNEINRVFGTNEVVAVVIEDKNHKVGVGSYCYLIAEKEVKICQVLGELKK